MDATRLKLARTEAISALVGLAIGTTIALAVYGVGELLWALLGDAA